MSAVSRPIKYTNNAREYGFLRLALAEAWGYRCFWCNKTREQGDFQINHIVPRGRLLDAIEIYGVEDDFDVNATGNLAPICSSGSQCNQIKSENVFQGAGSGLIVSKLKRASKLAGRVERKVHSLRSSRGISNSLVHAVTAKLDKSVDKAFKEHGAALVRRLRAVDPLMIDTVPTVYQHRPGPNLNIGDLPGCAPDDLADISVELDGEGRTAKTLVEVACQLEFSRFLDVLLIALYEEIDQRVANEAARAENMDDYALYGYRWTTLSGLEARRVDDGIAVKFQGDYRGNYSATDWHIDSDGSLEQGRQYDVSVYGEVHGNACLSFTGEMEEIEWDLANVVIEY